MKEKTIIKHEGAKIDEFTMSVNGSQFKYKIQEPTFSQLSEALTESMATSGKLNMAGGGKVIFELCCLEYDPELEKNPKLLLSVCLDLYNEYVLPADNEIKKN